MKLSTTQKKVLSDINATGKMIHGRANVWPTFKVLERGGLVEKTDVLGIYKVTDEGKKHI